MTLHIKSEVFLPFGQPSPSCPGAVWNSSTEMATTVSYARVSSREGNICSLAPGRTPLAAVGFLGAVPTVQHKCLAWVSSARIRAPSSTLAMPSTVVGLERLC